MTDLSGTLEGFGLPAIIRFVTELKKTGVLRIVHQDWHGEIVFEAGQLTSASLGSRNGLAALDALIEVLPGASFTFDASLRARSAANIELSAEALQAHLDELVARIGSGTPSLTAVDSVPELVVQEASGTGAHPLPLDRSTLQTLLAVDGHRTVRAIVALRGTFNALWQLGRLAEVGLVRPASSGVARASLEAPVDRPSPPANATGHCPKLGFEDDPGSSFSRPTRLHRCFAAATPLPLSLDQQRELCLSDKFGTCPRLNMIGRGAARPPGRDFRTLPSRTGIAGNAASGATEQARPDEPETDPPRIVRLPLAGSTSSTDGPAPSTRAPHRAQPAPVRGLLASPRLARFVAAPVPLIAALSVALIALAVIAYLFVPHMGNLFVDDTADLSGLPNASAVAAGTSIAQIFVQRTPVPIAPSDGTSASAASAAGAPAAPTLPPEAAAATAEPTAGLSQAPAATQAGAVLFDEKFAENTHNWPSNPQGTAWLTSGSYRLIPRQAGRFVAVGAPIADVPQDVIVSATFHKLSGTPEGGGFGIILRDQGPGPRDGTSQSGQYYVVEVGDKGEIGMWRREMDRWVDIVPWQHADAVHPGTATNELVVSAIGTRLILTVNGTPVVTRTDTTLSTGGVGMLVGGDGNQVAVDHFIVQTP